MNTQSQRGNALWFILIAIVLLGGLTIMLSRSGSSTQQTGNVEQNRIKASQLMRYAKGIENAIEQMKLQGISENEISFENPTSTADYTNPICDDATDPHFPACRVFGTGGAGLTYQEFPIAGDIDGLTDSTAFPGAVVVTGIGYDADGTAAGDVDLLLVAAVSEDLCNQINRDLGGTVDAADMTAAIDDWDQPFQGTFAAANFIIGGSNADEAPGLEGRAAGCIIDDAGGFIFYQVLLAR